MSWNIEDTSTSRVASGQIKYAAEGFVSGLAANDSLATNIMSLACCLPRRRARCGDARIQPGGPQGGRRRIGDRRSSNDKLFEARRSWVFVVRVRRYGRISTTGARPMTSAYESGALLCTLDILRTLGMGMDPPSSDRFLFDFTRRHATGWQDSVSAHFRPAILVIPTKFRFANAWRMEARIVATAVERGLGDGRQRL